VLAGLVALLSFSYPNHGSITMGEALVSQGCVAEGLLALGGRMSPLHTDIWCLLPSGAGRVVSGRGERSICGSPGRGFSSAELSRCPELSLAPVQ